MMIVLTLGSIGDGCCLKGWDGSIGVMIVLTLGSIGDGCCLKGWDGSIGVMGAVLKVGMGLKV